MTDRLYVSYDSIKAYVDMLRLKGRKQRTLTEYRYRLRMCVKALREEDLETRPKVIGKEEVHYILFELLKGKSNKYKHHTIQIFSRWLVVMGKNDIVSQMDFLWPHSESCVTWLTVDQVMYIKDVTSGIDHLAIHLAFDLGLRCFEVSDLLLSDIRYPWIYVLGKGHMEGKLAPVYMHEDTAKIIAEYMKERDEIVRIHMKLHPEIPVPNNLLLHNHSTKGIATAYNRKTIGNRMIKLSHKLGIDFSMHTFRRAYATMLSDCDVPLEVIKEAMRHENIETTAKYIQKNPKKLIQARKTQEKYQENLKCLKPSK